MSDQNPPLKVYLDDKQRNELESQFVDQVHQSILQRAISGYVLNSRTTQVWRLFAS